MTDESSIRHQSSNRIDTFRDGGSLGEEATVTAAIVSPTRPIHLPDRAHDATGVRQYGAAMATTTANAIATGIRRHLRDRITYLPDRKLHALLYLAQGLWLATDTKPLFGEDLIATGHGAHVDYITSDATSRPLTDAEFTVVALVCSRYGGLSTMDLEALIRGQGPWAAASQGAAIDTTLIRDQFRRQDDIPEGTMSGLPRSARERAHRPAGYDTPAPPTPDSPEEIAAFIAEVEARM